MLGLFSLPFFFFFYPYTSCLFVCGLAVLGPNTNSVHPMKIIPHNCHTETKAADPTCYFTLARHSGIRATNLCTHPTGPRRLAGNKQSSLPLLWLVRGVVSCPWLFCMPGEHSLVRIILFSLHGEKATLIKTSRC